MDRIDSHLVQLEQMTTKIDKKHYSLFYNNNLNDITYYSFNIKY
jgi:hypothetical protein